MARCRIGDKKVKKLREQTGLDIIHAYVRGSNDHAISLLLNGGSVVWLMKDGTIEKEDMKWKQDKEV